MPKLKKIPVRKPEHREMAIPDMPSMFPPSFYVDHKQMPEIKKWKVGEKYQMIVEVEQTNKSESKDGRATASFDIVAYAPMKAKKEYSEMTDAEFEEEEAKGLSS